MLWEPHQSHLIIITASPVETFEKCSILFKFKEGENLSLTPKLGKRGRFAKVSGYDIIEVGDAVFHVNSATGIGKALKSIFAEDSKLKKIKRLCPR